MSEIVDEIEQQDLACENTDVELWRERAGDYYADSIHRTQGGGIGINCGGHVRVQTLRAWFESAERADRAEGLLDEARQVLNHHLHTHSCRVMYQSAAGLPCDCGLDDLRARIAAHLGDRK